MNFLKCLSSVGIDSIGIYKTEEIGIESIIKNQILLL